MMILDRFEGDYGVIEMDGKMVEVKKELIDSKVKEGDVLLIKEGIYYRYDEATKKRKKEIGDRFRDMWED
ncbi:DUF3006 domain-containing protein [Clostridium formicaceticum]|uniref:Uncharacterized protein n=1 Tax=Clostridium formicaceticum TaxID=1497 RepID=A0AAC9WFP1_9CLOT|nr:DUF3006 domain-containing protein [Clostridium formicaceticum]AOY76488.1 hypothetical protein BJL90_11835 [Clostridium formicaceticum]ARE86894.1 hypothetical protein CLFO_12780 [Clostridium formicaceticum]